MFELIIEILMLKYLLKSPKDTFYPKTDTTFYSKKVGLCLNLGYRITDDNRKNTLNKYMTTYPNFSGNYYYPLKDTVTNKPAEDIYKYYSNNKLSMYNTKTAYGRERMKLFQYIQDCIINDAGTNRDYYKFLLDDVTSIKKLHKAAYTLMKRSELMLEFIDTGKRGHNGYKFTRTYGLCHNLITHRMYKRNHYLRIFLTYLMTSWSEFSGNRTYPINYLDCTKHPQDAYVIHDREGNLYEGDYGNSRIRLLKFINEACRNIYEITEPKIELIQYNEET